MTTKYDALEAKATKAQQNGYYRDSGDNMFYGPSPLDVAVFEEAASPAAVLGLIADVKALAEALHKIEQGTTSEWVAMTASAALKRIQEEAG